MCEDNGLAVGLLNGRRGQELGKLHGLPARIWPDRLVHGAEQGSDLLPVLTIGCPRPLVQLSAKLCPSLQLTSFHRILVGPLGCVLVHRILNATLLLGQPLLHQLLSARQLRRKLHWWFWRSWLGCRRMFGSRRAFRSTSQVHLHEVTLHGVESTLHGVESPLRGVESLSRRPRICHDLSAEWRLRRGQIGPRCLALGLPTLAWLLHWRRW
mmetsp:Transcript_59461/g.128588  ORF Transcript_59461/g.128588 Transcript_59461/m.128588 type:complete len:211 (-) Transcript_59461:601-1233(-)